MVKKKKISARISPYNYEFIRCIADALFSDGKEGNFSEALDFLLFVLRKRTDLSLVLNMIAAKGMYERGYRDEHTLALKKSGELVAKIIEKNTE